MIIPVLLLAIIYLVNCKNVLIISDAESANVSKLIRSINSNDNIEEIYEKNAPSTIVNADNEAIYHTIYYLKTSNKENQVNWKPEEVSNYVQVGGNFLTTWAISEKILNQFGVEVIEGEIEGGQKDKLISGSVNHQHAFSAFDFDPELDTNHVFNLRNDPKNDNKYNALIQSAMFLTPGNSICPKSSRCVSSSQSISLLATMESRKGSRFVAISSLNLATQEVLQWVQGERFNLKISSVSHRKSEGAVNRGKTELETTIYRINDKINVRMCLIDAVTQLPFHAENPNDFQFELKMMNIQLRKSFDSESDGCLIVNNVQLPPKPAVYTLRISHNRPGWSQLNWEERILVRPFRHDEFPRFLRVAFPYYLSWIGILFASYFILLPRFFKHWKV